MPSRKNISGRPRALHTSPMDTPDLGRSSNSTHPEPLLSIRTDLAQPSGYGQMAANDVPDLFYDCDQYDAGYTSSPPSAASSSLMPTPLYDWDMPLPVDGSPSLTTKQTLASSSFSMDQWPLSAQDSYPPWDSSSSSKLFQYQPSSACEYSDELGWEKQRHTPGNPPSNLTAPSHRDSQSKPISTSHPASATHDTQHHKQFIPASSSSSESSASSSTISPSILMLAQNTSSAATPTPTSAVSQLSPTQLHHPRPSRRIPIISLAELASASGAVLQKKVPQVRKRSSRHTLSPLPIDCNGFTPSLARQHRYDPYLSSVPSGSAIFSRRGVAAITCSCGCMETYAV
ncbi:hypothetical protein BKA70DRAFT_306846 [Coprinopsis sp. MPI-PUGE-AT-0042]|nr:hypothetical protein BKA70DRAFT_306846 [Coprinopsis sp. MPI-PUGE-AT-0042]